MIGLELAVRITSSPLVFVAVAVVVFIRVVRTIQCFCSKLKCFCRINYLLFEASCFFCRRCRVHAARFVLQSGTKCTRGLMLFAEYEPLN